MPKIGNKALISPRVWPHHDEDEKNLVIEVELPGVSKDDVKLEMTDEGFCVSGERPEFIYRACYKFLHDVEFGKAGAKYNNGLLVITVPFQKTRSPVQVEIEEV
jgi:HSP20 family molecular chaperone IbpA